MAAIPLMTGLVCLGLAVAPLFDTKFVFFELLSHFPLQAACAAAGVFVLSLPWRKKIVVCYGLIALFCALVANGAWLYPYWNIGARAASPDTAHLKIAQVNARASNRDFAATVSWLRRVKSDVLVAGEVDQGWLEALSALSELFPFHVSRPRDDNFGMAVFSRFPITHGWKAGLPIITVPAFFLRLHVAGRAVRLAAVHTVPPMTQKSVTARNLSLRMIVQWAAAEPSTPTFVVGDLIVTPFAAPFRVFVKYGALKDSRTGPGLLTNWTGFYPRVLRIPIDYILHDRHARTLTLSTGDHNGSDRLPLIGKFVFVEQTICLPN